MAKKAAQQYNYIDGQQYNQLMVIFYTCLFLSWIRADNLLSIIAIKCFYDIPFETEIMTYKMEK